MQYNAQKTVYMFEPDKTEFPEQKKSEIYKNIKINKFSAILCLSDNSRSRPYF